MSVSLDNSCKILRCAGLRDHDIYPILNEIKKWVDRNGEEWTVKRLKILKQGYVNLLAHGSFNLPDNSWVKHTKTGPRGPFRVLCKLKKPWKALSAFMVYTGFKAKSVTDSQWKKFHEAVNSRPPEPFVLDILSPPILKAFKGLPIRDDGQFWRIDDVSERQTRVPSWVDGKLKTVQNGFDAIMDNIRAPFISKWMENRGGKIPLFASLYWRSNRELPNSYVGTIGLIQEPGYKLRTVANPFPVYQLALSKFGSCLYNALQRIEEDATFRQESAILDIQEYMREGGELVAFDLSSATDRFPFDLTLRCLQQVEGIHSDDLDLWSRVSRATWKSPYGDISWSNGQPLGVYPSFAAFALSHHAVVRSVTQGFYRILGDDVVINKVDSQKLAKLYEALGCDISHDKSIDSPHLTEFGGRLITKDKILAQPKWHDISDRSFMDLARQVGPTILGLLKPRQKHIVKILSEVPSALHPYGLNWNPKGKPFIQRWEESKQILAKLGLKDDLIPQSSEQSKILSDVALAVKTRSYSRSYNIHIRDAKAAVDSVPIAMSHDRRERKDSVSNGDFETRVLRHLGIDHIEGLNLLPGWYVESLDTSSDPRGSPTLDILEKKLGVRSRIQRSRNP